MRRNVRKGYSAVVLIALGSLLTVACGRSPHKSVRFKSLGERAAATVGARTRPTPPRPSRVVREVTAPQLTTINFLDPLHGWAAGEGIILATNDGGKRWRTQYRGQETFTQIQAVTPAVAFVLGQGSLLGTSDGGRNWTALAEPSKPLHQIDFVTPKVGFGLAGPPGSYNLFMVRTLDGGQTWRAIDQGVPTSSICFASARRGWAIGENGMVETDDGGATWRKCSSVLPEGAEDDAIGEQIVGCAAPETVYVEFVAGAAMSQQPYSLYRSSDGGNTWQPVMATLRGPVGPAPGNPQGVPRAPGAKPGPIVVVNRRAVVAAGLCPACGWGTTAIGWTEDAGRTWHNSTDNLATGIENVAISFPTIQTGWLVCSPQRGETEILITHNAGRTWRTQWRYPILRRDISQGSPTVTLAVTPLPTTFGVDNRHTPPRRITVTIPARWQGKIGAYWSSGIILAPTGWTGQGIVGADGSWGVDMYPPGGSPNSGEHITLFSTSPGAGTVAAAQFFRTIRDNWNQYTFVSGSSPPTPVKVLSETHLSANLIAYQLPSTAGGLERNGVAYSELVNHPHSVSPFIGMRTVLPRAEHGMATVSLNYFISHFVPHKSAKSLSR